MHERGGGFQQINELTPRPKITVFSAGLHAGAREQEAAKALVKALAAPDALSKAHGMARS
jgi:hypothetical protein